MCPDCIKINEEKYLVFSLACAQSLFLQNPNIKVLCVEDIRRDWTASLLEAKDFYRDNYSSPEAYNTSFPYSTLLLALSFIMFVLSIIFLILDFNIYKWVTLIFSILLYVIGKNASDEAQ